MAEMMSRNSHCTNNGELNDGHRHRALSSIIYTIHLQYLISITLNCIVLLTINIRTLYLIL